MSGYAIEHRGQSFTPEGKVDTPASDIDECNRETSRAEVAAFKARDNDGRYFAYMGGAIPSGTIGGTRIQTWMGDELATVSWLGHVYASPGFYRPSKRQNFRALGIDGQTWSGTFYVSAGDYVRMRVVAA